jgi:para-aminobenzoate synthetase component I
MNSSTRFFLFPNTENNLLALGVFDELIFDYQDSLESIDAFLLQNQHKYIFSWIAYDLKNKIEKLHSKNKAYIQFPLAYFCVPELVVSIINKNEIKVVSGRLTEALKREILTFLKEDGQPLITPIALVPTMTQQDYLNKVEGLKQHIQRGDIYEITFCQDFRASNVLINPKSLFQQLNKKTYAPMAAYVEWGHKFLLCGSPERFLKRVGNQLISQPIKGTAKRASEPSEDLISKENLKRSEKEQAENVMIVDLVRNDLSRLAIPNSVKVDELFGIYTFKTVHQMISTITAEVAETTTFSEILKALFPMGSMTGAPKIRAMELIDEFEDFQRGIFSGAVGYIAPNGNFDFNVVIRSIVYDAENQRVSCPVGSAITIKSNSVDEYNECLLKVEAMKSVLNGETES